jgi:hypothetical protein
MTSEAKAVALFGENLPVEKFGGALKALAGAARQRTGDHLFLKLAKSGEWLFGPEEIEVESDERWAINPASFKIGVIGWENGNVVEEIMFAFTSDERVDMSTLKRIDSNKDGDGWKEQISVEMRHMEEDISVLYGTTSLGGRNAMADLAAAIGDRMETDPDTPVAVVELHVDSYKHKKYGKIFTPEIRVVDWVDMNGDKPKAKAKGKKRNLTG